MTGLSSRRYVRSWQANQKQSIPSTNPASPIPNFGQKLALTKKAPATEPTNKPAPVIFQNRAASLTRSFRTTVELCSNIDSMSSPLSQDADRRAPAGAYDGRIADSGQSSRGSARGRHHSRQLFANAPSQPRVSRHIRALACDLRGVRRTASTSTGFIPAPRSP